MKDGNEVVIYLSVKDYNFYYNKLIKEKRWDYMDRTAVCTRCGTLVRLTTQHKDYLSGRCKHCGNEVHKPLPPR